MNFERQKSGVKCQATRILLTGWLLVQALVGVGQQVDSTAVTNAPYQLQKGREIALLGAGVVTLGTSIVLSHTIDPLTPAAIAGLNPAEVNAFDRSATRLWLKSADRLSDVTLVGNIALLGLATLGGKPMRQEAGTVAILYAETLLLANGIERTIKAVTQRTRPFVYNPDAPLDEKITRDARQSFFSGHATNAFATAVFTGEVFQNYFPHSRLKPFVWGGALGLATATAVLRYEGGLHYPSDLLAGAAFGSLVGWGIPRLHQLTSRTRLGHRLNVQPWSSGSANGIYARLLVFSR